MKARNRAGNVILGTVSVLSLAALAGCMSMQSQGTLDAIDSSLKGASASPYVEGYIEYPGPQSKWSGPSPFIVHVSARDAGRSKVSIQPALFDDLMPAPEGAGRAPASQQGLSSETAREMLAHLATSLQGPEQAFSGCLYPVRVRLIRADGSLLDRQGCRGEKGWNRSASQAVNSFIRLTTQGEARLPASVPASEPASVPAAAPQAEPKQADGA